MIKRMAVGASNIVNKINKPKTRKGKKFFESRQPKLIEDTKKAIFLRGSTAKDYCIKLLKDLCAIKKPNAVFYNSKQNWRPFEDSSHIEFFASKNDASLFGFASSSKKRPNNLILGRTFDGHILDMVEFEAQNYKTLSDFKVLKPALGTKPMIIFSGETFDIEFEYHRLKNLLFDFFSGPKTDAIRLAGLEHVIHFVAADGKIFMRSYRIVLMKSGTKLPRIELEEIGPRVDLIVKRTHFASEDLFKRATRQPKQLKKKTIKNIKKDLLGTTFGRIHLERQDYSKLKVKKMKGLRQSGDEKKRNVEGEPSLRIVQDGQGTSEEEKVTKRILKDKSQQSGRPKKRVKFDF